jgi:alginate O-acetyltransferase complex protein AlgI
VFFAFQIYCDFSGYSDTARGVARTLGFQLISNFEQPYFSRNPVEFWRRWHISLSQWFQDYLYFPLAMHYMRKGGWASKYKAHIVSMGLIGFWHGANWTFIVFGLYWGVVIAGYLYLQERFAEAEPGTALARLANTSGNSRVAGALSIAFMFVVVCVGWTFFRANSLGQAWEVLSGMVAGAGVDGVLRPEVVGASTLWSLVIGLWIAEWIYLKWPALGQGVAARYVPRLIVRQALMAAILFSYIVVQQGQVLPFIYFQF